MVKHVTDDLQGCIPYSLSLCSVPGLNSQTAVINKYNTSRNLETEADNSNINSQHLLQAVSML